MGDRVVYPSVLAIVKAEQLVLELEFNPSLTCWKCSEPIPDKTECFLVKEYMNGKMVPDFWQYVHIECHALMKEEVKEEIAKLVIEKLNGV